MIETQSMIDLQQVLYMLEMALEVESGLIWTHLWLAQTWEVTIVQRLGAPRWNVAVSIAVFTSLIGWHMIAHQKIDCIVSLRSLFSCVAFCTDHFIFYVHHYSRSFSD